MADPTPDPELTAFADLLARASPHPGTLDRDRLLFAAGRASARPLLRWAWPAAVAALALLAAGEGAWLWRRPPDVVERVVVVRLEPKPDPLPAPQAPSPGPDTIDDAEARAWGEGLRLRREVLRHGVVALPAPRAWPATTHSAVDDPLGTTGGVLSPRGIFRHLPDGEETR